MNSAEKKILFVIFLALWTIIIHAQAVKIFEDSGHLGPCEPSISINPKYPDTLVAGSVLDYVHYSHDGGKTWDTRRLKSTFGVYGDPCLVSDKNGNTYYFHLADPDHEGWKSDRILESIVVQKSKDGGKTWTKGVEIGKNPPKDQDKEWAYYDPFGDRLYVAWTEFDKYGDSSSQCKSRILFSFSQNGNVWSTPAVLSQKKGNCIDDDQTPEGAVPCVGANGEIYVSWAYDGKIIFDKSENGKKWHRKDKKVVNQIGGWSVEIPGIGRANGMPITRCDISSSPYEGRIYICYADMQNGSHNSDIFLVYSDDYGKNWSPPFLINDLTQRGHQFFPWMSIDPITGYLYIVYYDRSNTENNENNVVLSWSKNGGKTFSHKKLTENSFPSPGEGIFFGDYNNIDAYNGIVRPVWTEWNGKKLSVWTYLFEE